MGTYFVDKHLSSKSIQIITTKQLMKFTTISEMLLLLSSCIFMFLAKWNDEKQELKNFHGTLNCPFFVD